MSELRLRQNPKRYLPGAQEEGEWVAEIRESISSVLRGAVSVREIVAALPGLLIGIALVGASNWLGAISSSGWRPVGALVGIVLVVCSLFGDVPPSVAWLQRFGAWVFPGIALGAVALLVPFLLPAAGRDSSIVAFSPSVWAAYIAIIFVGISFEMSGFAHYIYLLCLKLPVGPATIIPLYVLVMGLLGNVLDGVSIMAISVVIFLRLLPMLWALRASFALLFGGLIANLVTVAAEPTNIKFQDVLHAQLDKAYPTYWFTNWPISVLGILLPTLWLAISMRKEVVNWRERMVDADAITETPVSHPRMKQALGLAAILLLAAGIIAHSIILAQWAAAGNTSDAPLWLFTLPAGIAALLHLRAIRHVDSVMAHVREQAPVWGKIMVIFSLLWLLENASQQGSNVFVAFFTWPEQVRYGLMIVLSLASSITDNVALAAMQGSLLLFHPLAIWQMRFLFILLTWAGGFTPFGCLQSLTTNSRLRLSMSAWFKESLPWAAVTIVGGLCGLALIALLYPHAVGLAH